MDVIIKRRRLVMPLLVLGALVFSSVAVYMYILNNKHRFITTKKEPFKRPSNVIYLPADLDAAQERMLSCGYKL